MKKTIKKVKKYNFGGGVVRDTYFVNVWDEYGGLIYTTLGGFTKEEAIETKNNISVY
jgi:hypothetical protein